MTIKNVGEWTEQWNAGEQIGELSLSGSAAELTVKAPEREGEKSQDTHFFRAEESAHD